MIFCGGRKQSESTERSYTCLRRKGSRLYRILRKVKPATGLSHLPMPRWIFWSEFERIGIRTARMSFQVWAIQICRSHISPFDGQCSRLARKQMSIIVAYIRSDTPSLRTATTEDAMLRFCQNCLGTPMCQQHTTSTSTCTEILLKKCERPLNKLHKNRASRLARNALKSGRGSKIRTHNKGFGDPRVTITPCPYILSNKHYYTGFRFTCQYPFLQNLFPDLM